MLIHAAILALALQAQGQLGQGQPAPGQPATRFGAIVLENFRAWDTNHDGALTREEINAATREPRYHGDAAAVLAALKGWLDFVKEPPTLTANWFLDYRPLKFSPPDPSLSEKEKDAIIQREAQFGPSLISRYQTGIARIRRGPALLYKPSGPSLDDIHQGALGDCWLVAALGGVVARDPQAIVRMIETTPHGYVVHYPDGSNIAVGPITEAEIALDGADVSHGLWVRVFERSWGLRQPVTLHRRSPKTGVATVTLGANDALSGHFGESIILHDNIDANVPADELAKQCKAVRERLQDNLAHHRLVYVVSGRAKQARGIPGRHWHAVFGYDAATDSIRIWNPWGDTTRPGDAAYPRRGGFFSMPVEAFTRSFWSIVFETDEVMRPAKPGDTD